ncbi:MAG: electron transfer flavoprotein subunit beta/FixA family protein [Deltaproteobacteria bacterium]|mgnify:CR=1 FL=1|nr:electron transfer flavoprotein subunit beta/FixA family protein [Deltaproteobacteria bacterium]MBW1936195.1 electron transfer flavoprotein subunit beta/FixA family protein [Deltaproteobacteria bacterium]MBW1976978.1 electron transfer flavoprotein subunit beta/FixA family protein [Deltaproteobacteria bacterium]MBW2045548.1 electron transfer flavoprotein subunit beta/FixA family protein [Deltaproteobacteria bacterium]MBW2300137.1 electron transfer flavoprotein subunit beta/FixA family protein 
MDIVVCVKRVPLTQEVDLEIDPQKKEVRKDMLAYSINEWDNYAIEEAVLLKEKFGGDVTAVTVGVEDDEEVLRRCLAMGADRAIRVEPGDLSLDPFVISRILAEVIKGVKHDLVLTGVQADDVNDGAVGTMLAEHLGLNHAAVVTRVEPEGNEATIHIELEGGTDEVSKIKFPALLSIQTGINEPRYVSIMGIRKAAKKELKVVKVEELGLSEDDLTPWVSVDEVFLPPETEGAEIIEGDPGTVAEEILRIIKEKGVST